MNLIALIQFNFNFNLVWFSNRFGLVKMRLTPTPVPDFQFNFHAKHNQKLK